MFLILLSWIYLFATTLLFGVSIQRLLNINHENAVITIFFGCFGLTLFTSLWSIFLAVNVTYHLVIFIIWLALFFVNKSHLIKALRLVRSSFKILKPFFKGLLIVLLVLLLVKCASAPSLVDNETYYIQTIKWLNHYGYVKGLTNLHLFLGQTSGWHILQSGVNFAFIYNNLNDLSGFCLLLGNLYAIDKLNNYISNTIKSRMDLIIGLFPIFNVFLFEFIGAPSPDIAVYVIGLIIFSEFVQCYKVYSIHSFNTIFILSVFATFIKLTGIVFFVFTLILYFYYFIYTRRETKKLGIIALITFSLFVVKNTIITGNPLYPLHIEALQTDWSLPNTVNNYFSKYEKAASYGLSIEAYKNTSFIKRLISWITQSKLDAIFNILMLLLLVIIPFFIQKTKAFKLIYLTGVGFVVFLFFFSPQYRFFFPFLIWFTLTVASVVFKNKKVIYSLLSICLFLPIITILYNVNTLKLTNTKKYQAVNTFSMGNIIEPHSNSKYSNDFEEITLDNHIINSPTGIDFIWATGDIPLPAVNEKQLDYLGTYFYIFPKQYSNNLKDGFYSAPITND